MIMGTIIYIDQYKESKERMIFRNSQEELREAMAFVERIIERLGGLVVAKLYEPLTEDSTSFDSDDVPENAVFN